MPIKFKISPLITRSLLSAGGALIILIICGLWMNWCFTFTPEETFFGWQVRLKRMDILKHIRRDDIDPNEVTMIDLSGSKQLADEPESSGKVVISDQQQLTEILELLARRGNRHKFAIFDILIDPAYVDPSPVFSAAKKVRRLLFAASITRGNNIPPPGLLPSASVLYHTSQGLFITDHFVKYDYWEGHFKGLPLRMEEILSGKTFSKHTGGFLSTDHALYFQTTLLDFEFRSDSTDGDFSFKNMVPATEFIDALKRNDPGYYDHFCKDKYLLLGDFKTDSHNTALGPVPGPVILMNLFLTLHEGHTRITVMWLLFNVLLLSPLCYFLLYPQSHHLFRRLNSIENVPLGRLVSVSLLITVWVFTTSWLSYLIFNKTFQTTFFLVLLAGYEFLKTIWQVILHYGRRHILQTAVAPAQSPIQATITDASTAVRVKRSPAKKRNKPKTRKK